MNKIKLILLCMLCVITLTGCEDSVVVKEPSNNYEKVNTTSQVNDTNGQESTVLETQEKNEPEIIATFSTKIYDTSEGRMHNLKLASDNLSNTVINSGETFSFNDKMGPYSKDKGYEKGKIFDGDGDVMQEYGGRYLSNK